MYSCLLEDLTRRHVKKTRKKRKRKEGQKKKKDKGKKTHPNQTKKSKIAISVACILMRCKPLPNNVSTENGKNDKL